MPNVINPPWWLLWFLKPLFGFLAGFILQRLYLRKLNLSALIAIGLLVGGVFSRLSEEIPRMLVGYPRGFSPFGITSELRGLIPGAVAAVSLLLLCRQRRPQIPCVLQLMGAFLLSLFIGWLTFTIKIIPFSVYAELWVTMREPLFVIGMFFGIGRHINKSQDE